MQLANAATFAARNDASRKRKLTSATNGVNFKRELYEHNAMERHKERKFYRRRIIGAPQSGRMVGMKFFAILILCASALFGETISAKYEISFGVFGAVGSANTRLVRQGDRYEIVMDAVAQGVAGSLSGQRRESFRSRGRIVAGLLMPDLYVHEVSRKKGKTTKNERKTYAFDYARKTIKFQKFKGAGGELQLVSDEILPYFATNDLLSLFFNFSKIPHSGDKFFVRAAGAKGADGRIDIERPRGSAAANIASELGVAPPSDADTNSDAAASASSSGADTKTGTTDVNSKGRSASADKQAAAIYVVFINQPIFSSSRGELHLSLNERGYADRAVLKDVLLFGDIRARLVE